MNALGYDHVHNLLNLFENKYSSNENMNLQFKTFFGDDTVQHFVSQIEGASLSDAPSTRRVSDDSYIVKVIPEKKIITTKTGNEYTLGISSVFPSDLTVDLNNEKAYKHGRDVFDFDLKNSEDYFPSVVFSSDGKIGLDWVIYYHGNVSTWQNQVNDNLLNIMDDTPDDIFNGVFNDPLTVSFIENGARYRDGIVAEVDEKAVLRSKAICLRDFTGPILFEEERTRLYYTLRALQDYYKNGSLNGSEIESIPKEISYFIKRGNKDELIKEFKNSDFSIVDQYQEMEKA